MKQNEEALRLYHDFVVKRHMIYMLRMHDKPQPWTDDPVLQARKFTNVFRILDPGSQFVLTDLHYGEQIDYLARCVFYRITNLPKTWYAIRANLGRYPNADDFLEYDRLVGILTRHRDAGNQIFSGAYVIIPEPGTTNDKVEGAVRVTKKFLEKAVDTFFESETQEQRYLALRSTPGIGNFLAMQILTDWGYGQQENRENEFISAGPGARRGADHLIPGAPPEEVIEAITHEWAGHYEVRIGTYRPSLMDVQNTMCEFSKYYPLTMGWKHYTKTPYKPAHPGPFVSVSLPFWMV